MIPTLMITAVTTGQDEAALCAKETVIGSSIYVRARGSSPVVTGISGRRSSRRMRHPENS